jgi:hypothetical protein
MKKMGWVEGKGLGKSLQGISEPIRAVKKDDNSGVLSFFKFIFFAN